jgi:Zn-finger protein
MRVAMNLEIDPWVPKEGVTYVKECSNCSAVDRGDTVDELEIAMANHICEVE